MFKATSWQRGTALLAMAILCGLPGPLQAQTGPQLKHRVFLYWGYNRAQFSQSDIRLSGDGYAFTLHDVAAKDRPEPFAFGSYFKPANIWIPQYNYRVGWFPSGRWSISLGLDHMKYVMIAGQRVGMSGYVDRGRHPHAPAAAVAGVVELTPDVLTYEHTDGLNLLSIDVDHYFRLWASANGRHAVHLTGGLLAGPVIPRSDVRLFGEGLNNNFHLSGYGAGGQLGIFAVLWDRLFARVSARAGFINLPDVLTTGRAEDRASQHFWFVQENAVIGVLIGKGNRKEARGE